MKISDYTGLYSELDIAYNQAMSGPYRDIGCPEADDGEIPGVCVAALKDGRIDGFWRPMVCFGGEQFQRDIIERMWSWSHDITYQDFLIGGQLSPVSRFLLEKGYTVTPYYTQVIDLRRSEADLRAGLRKSYRSLVNKLAGINLCTVAEFREIHHRVKGHTRPDETWRIQEQMNPLCVRADDGRCGVMFYWGPTWAYYASAAGDDSHACIWRALIQLRALGVQFCEMGEQVFAGDPKAVSISHFKAGFGGETRVRLNLRKRL